MPDLIGRFIAAKLPGTQRSGLSSLQILREKHGSAIDGRLAGCEGLVEGLTAASSRRATRRWRQRRRRCWVGCERRGRGSIETDSFRFATLELRDPASSILRE